MQEHKHSDGAKIYLWVTVCTPVMNPDFRDEGRYVQGHHFELEMHPNDQIVVALSKIERVILLQSPRQIERQSSVNLVGSSIMAVLRSKVVAGKRKKLAAADFGI